MKQRLFIPALLFFSLLILFSCDPSLIGYEWNNIKESRGLVIKLTDEPIDAEEVNIDVQ